MHPSSKWWLAPLMIAVVGLALAAASSLQAKPEAAPAAAHLTYVMNVFCMNNGEGDTLQVMEKALNDKHAAKGQELVAVVPIMSPITRKDPAGNTISPNNCYIYYFKNGPH